MKEQEKIKITLPRELQKQMLKFFLDTSIPRIKNEKQAKITPLSEKSDRSDDD
jgi:hypothetical protein